MQNLHSRLQGDADEIKVCQTPRRPYMLGYHLASGTRVIFQPRCKMWGCEACAEINKNHWSVKTRLAAEILISEGVELWFTTITGHRKLDRVGTLEVFPDAWKKMRSRIKYHAGNWHYLMIPELHKDGRMHVHMIESSGLGTRWFKDNCAECGLGHQAKAIKMRSTNQVVNYVTKYIGKSIAQHKSAWPKYFRRVRTSQNWPKPPPPIKPHGWEFKKIDKKTALRYHYELAVSTNEKLIFTDHKRAWAVVEQYLT